MGAEELLVTEFQRRLSPGYSELYKKSVPATYLCVHLPLYGTIICSYCKQRSLCSYEPYMLIILLLHLDQEKSEVRGSRTRWLSAEEKRQRTRGTANQEWTEEVRDYKRICKGEI